METCHVKGGQVSCEDVDGALSVEGQGVQARRGVVRWKGAKIKSNAHGGSASLRIDRQDVAHSIGTAAYSAPNVLDGP